jgi:hypothetical protein
VSFVNKSAIKFPLATEMGAVILFLGAWLFPVIASWGVAVSGRQFSVQNQNVEIVGMCILVALASGIVAAVVVLSCLEKMPRFRLSITMMPRINRAQRFFLVSVALIAAIGLFKSFSGTIFEKSYEGPSIVWLGYGAWSVTFLLSINLLVGDFFATRSFQPVMVIALSAIFLPFLLSGSRIDFLSSMLVLVAYMLVLHEAKFKFRVLGALAILVWMVIVISLIGQARYVFFDPSLKFSPSIPVGFAGDMFYLSTIGDLGVSVFQIVGLVQEQINNVVGMETAALTYAVRLLPGPFFANRPGDLWLKLSEPIGGGALHSLGEGYLIYGLAGCALMGVVFGVLAAISISAGNCFRSTRSPVWWILFAFPWLLLIRGGWYQFFSILKSVEILVFLLLFLAGIGRMGVRCSKI